MCDCDCLATPLLSILHPIVVNQAAVPLVSKCSSTASGGVRCRWACVSSARFIAANTCSSEPQSLRRHDMTTRGRRMFVQRDKSMTTGAMWYLLPNACLNNAIPVFSVSQRDDVGVKSSDSIVPFGKGCQILQHTRLRLRLDNEFAHQVKLIVQEMILRCSSSLAPHSAERL